MPSASPAGYRYVAEIRSEEGEELGVVALQPDFGPALECCHLAGVGAAVLPATAVLPPGSVHPVWSDEVGAPYVGSLRVRMEAARGDDPVVVEFDVSRYLRAEIRRGVARLVEQGRLPEGTRYRSRVQAYAASDSSDPARAAARRAAAATLRSDGLDFEIDEAGDALPIVERAVGASVAARFAGDDADDPCPVLVHAEVEEDLVALATAAGENECGAGLLGHLARDPQSGRLFVEVTALAPARGGLSERRAFVFTDDSWASIREIADLRGRDELVVGWAHSHPNFCAKCPPERQARCAAAEPFFSEDDVHLHRTCFPKAWQVALLASDVPAHGRLVSLFGWRDAVVTARSFITVAARDAVAARIPDATVSSTQANPFRPDPGDARRGVTP
jgi:proteasome lid subunit RPN8/RPN11